MCMCLRHSWWETRNCLVDHCDFSSGRPYRLAESYLLPTRPHEAVLPTFKLIALVLGAMTLVDPLMIFAYEQTNMGNAPSSLWSDTSSFDNMSLPLGCQVAFFWRDLQVASPWPVRRQLAHLRTPFLHLWFAIFSLQPFKRRRATDPKESWQGWAFCVFKRSKMPGPFSWCSKVSSYNANEFDRFQGKPLSEFLIIEVFAGTARLSITAREAGFWNVPVDKSSERCKGAHIAIFDLSVDEEINRLLEIIKAERHNKWESTHDVVHQRRIGKVKFVKHLLEKNQTFTLQDPFKMFWCRLKQTGLSRS